MYHKKKKKKLNSFEFSKPLEFIQKAKNCDCFVF